MLGKCGQPSGTVCFMLRGLAFFRISVADQPRIGQRLPARHSLFALAIASIVISGCTAVHKHQDVQSYIASLSVEHNPNTVLAPLSDAPDKTAPAGITFAEVCARAARFDDDITGALADEMQAQIDLEQAHSVLFPRANLKTYFQIPLDAGDIQGMQIFNGGVFLNYDFNAVIFYKDEMEAARATIDSKRERTRILIEQLTHDLFLLLANRDAIQKEVALRATMRSQAKDALETANILAKTGQIKPQRVFEFRNQYDTSVRQYLDAVHQLDDLNRTLGYRLLIDNPQSIVVSDFPEFLSSIDGTVPSFKPGDAFFTALWSKRHDTKLLEANLFLEEMAIVNERRKRIPKFTASVGAGSNSLTSSYQQAPFVIQLGLTVPLVDFGDIKRSVTKASIDRDEVKFNITTKFLQIYHDVTDSAAVLSGSIASRKVADDNCAQAVRQKQNNQQLVKSGLADPLDIFGSEQQLEEAQIEASRARMDETKAAAGYAWNTLQDIVAGEDTRVLSQLGSNPFARSGQSSRSK
jgi:outer membrane protein TolC